MPSQVFDEQVICCLIDDPVGVDMRHKMNIDMICWECDYPHSDSTWPQSPEAVLEADAGVALLRRGHRQDHARQRDAALQLRPVLDARRKENCTVGALREQAEGWDVSIVARGIKATGVGAIDLLKFAKADRD